MDYYSKKLTPVETNYTTRNKKNVCGGNGIEILTTFDPKNKTQSACAHGPQGIVVFFGNEKIKPKTSTMARKTCMLRFRNQTYKKNYRGRCFKQEAGLQKPKQINKTNVNQKQ